MKEKLIDLGSSCKDSCCSSLEQVLLEASDLLDNMVLDTIEGGWSTNNVDSMNSLSSYLRRIVLKNKRNRNK